MFTEPSVIAKRWCVNPTKILVDERLVRVLFHQLRENHQPVAVNQIGMTRNEG